ncbi:hypothetical protein AAFF_G00125120 [Aldrovandia affinis]|uniref:Secreted protein n=1 Tax=Aldrovandia affinis TaxID=143900 RepID=A0AAD7RRA4_9TELE|nr:hypothetical protein AAFF_G00125120 [Aldrovandia affinis]
MCTRAPPSSARPALLLLIGRLISAFSSPSLLFPRRWSDVVARPLTDLSKLLQVCLRAGPTCSSAFPLCFSCTSIARIRHAPKRVKRSSGGKRAAQHRDRMGGEVGSGRCMRQAPENRDGNHGENDVMDIVKQRQEQETALCTRYSTAWFPGFTHQASL